MPQILYEDNHLLIINKNPGEIVQGDKTGDISLCESLKEFIKKRDNKPGNVFLGVVHRLDRPVGGAVIFAKTSKALTRLNEMLRNGEIHKTYWAITRNRPPKEEDTLTHYLSTNEKINKSHCSSKQKNGAKQAILNYRLLTCGKTLNLLEIELITGRKHQIRAQLAAIGCPIRGDLKYGDKRSNPLGDISLLARKIEFVHPVSKVPISINAPIPNENVWQSITSDIIS